MTQRLGLILILIAITCFQHQPVNGDEALIKTVCEWTQWPDVCQQCLSSTDASYVQTERDLGSRSINCAWTQTDTVIDDFAGMGNSTGDDALKALCVGCQGFLMDAEDSLEDALMDWSDGKYQDAGDNVEIAEDRFSDCVQLFFYMNPPLTLPQPFSDHFSALIKDYINSEDILNNL